MWNFIVWIDNCVCVRECVRACVCVVFIYHLAQLTLWHHNVRDPQWDFQLGMLKTKLLWLAPTLWLLWCVYSFDWVAMFIVCKHVSHWAEEMFIAHLGQQGDDDNSFTSLFSHLSRHATCESWKCCGATPSPKWTTTINNRN